MEKQLFTDVCSEFIILRDSIDSVTKIYSHKMLSPTPHFHKFLTAFIEPHYKVINSIFRLFYNERQCDDIWNILFDTKVKCAFSVSEHQEMSIESLYNHISPEEDGIPFDRDNFPLCDLMCVLVDTELFNETLSESGVNCEEFLEPFTNIYSSILGKYFTLDECTTIINMINFCTERVLTDDFDKESTIECIKTFTNDFFKK